MSQTSRPSALKYSGGALFRHFRKNHGLTQQHLALALGITTRYVKRIEAGERFPSPKLMERFKLLVRCHEREVMRATVETWRV